MLVIADTGSGPTIFRMVDVATAVEECGMHPAWGNLVTSDGSPLEGLCGRTAATMRWAGHTKEHTVTTQVMDRMHMTLIIDMDFWQPHNTVFNLRDKTITIETEEEHGSVAAETIECWCEQNSEREAEAVLHQQGANLQGALKWNQSQRQAEGINITVATIDEQMEQVKQAMADKMLHTVCRATEDTFIPPGCKQEKAITATIDASAAELHRTMEIEVNSLKRMAHQDGHEFEPDSDGEEPELLSESE